MGASLVQLSDETFDEFVGAATTPVVVDFWAEWCGPCKMLDSVLEELAGEYGDTVAFAGVDSDVNLRTTSRFDVMSVPTLLVFRDGTLVKRLVGARPKRALREALGEHLDTPATL
jgi:thioredoxin 1